MSDYRVIDGDDLTSAEKQAMLWDASVTFYGFPEAALGRRRD